MKTKLLFTLILSLSLFYSYANKNCNYLNCVITVDKKLVLPSALSNGHLIYKLKGANDTIDFKYNVGTLLFTDESYKKIKNLNLDTEIEIVFTIIQSSTKWYTRTYQMSLESSLLFHSFLVFDVYNYDSKINEGEFPHKNGYGIEFSTGYYSLRLPRKAK